MNTRPSELLYLDQRTSETGTTLLKCPNGIPFGWFVLFGGRNYWEPDQLIEERGGVSSERDQLISPLEVSQPRLQNALDAFNQSPHLWPWVCSLEVLNKRLKTRSRKGFLKLQAPWASKEDLHSITKSTAYMENVVYQINSGNLNVSKLLTQFNEHSPWSPNCLPEDQERFQKTLKTLNMPKSIVSLGELMIGTPEQNQDRFEEQLQEVCLNPFSAEFQFPQYPVFVDKKSSENDSSKASLSLDTQNDKKEKSSFFSRLFTRK